MNIQRTLARGFILFIALVIIYHLGYRPIIYWRDNILMERAKRIHQGMTMQEVTAILGKPKEERLLDIEMAKGRVANKKAIEEIAKKNQEILFHGYWVPMILKWPIFLHISPARTIVDIFYDENGNVALISIGVVADEGGIYIGGWRPPDWE